MWCANQQQMRQSIPVLTETPPVLVDWLPWNHTFGGNHNFGMVLYNGGTMYIDESKPVPALIDETLHNLREIAYTIYFNVPTGFEAIANAMKTDRVLRKNFLSKVSMFFYAGAGLSQPVWDSLFESEELEIGQRIVMTSGFGMTESGPFGLFVISPNVQAGDLGLPPNLVGMINSFEKRGLIAKRPHPSDGRAKGLHPTSPGDALLQKAEKTAQDLEDEATSGLSSAERKTLIRLLKKVYL